MKISVIVTCHNLEKYLDECIGSLMAQTEPVHEIILIHDGCTNPKLYDNVKVITRSFNKGVSYSRNEATSYTTGDRLLFMDADDTLTENFIEESMKVKADIVYPDVLLWSYWSDKPQQNRMYYPPDKITHDLITKRNYVVITSLMKKEVFNVVKGFEDFPLWEDWHFWLKAFRKGFKFKKSKAILKYRQRRDGRNRQNEHIQKEVYKKILSVADRS